MLQSSARAPPIQISTATPKSSPHHSYATPKRHCSACNCTTQLDPLRTADTMPLPKRFTAAGVSSGIQVSRGLAQPGRCAEGCAVAGVSRCVQRQRRHAAKRLGPLYHHRRPKGCDVLDLGTYKGIAFRSLPAEVYASIVITHLSAWCEPNKLRARGQAGFRKGHKTVD